MSTYPNVATGDLTSSVIGSLFNRSRAASMLAAKSKKEAFKRFKSVGLTDKQAQDAVDHYNFGGAAFKSRFGGDRVRRIRGFFGSKRPQDDITVTEKERVLRGMGLFTKKRKLNSRSEYSDSRDQESNFGNSGLPGGEGNEDQSFSPMQGLLPPVGDNLEEALKGVGANGEYLTKEQRIEIFKKNRVARDVDSIFNKSSSTPPSSPTPAAIQKVETGNLIGSAIEKIFEDKNKELVEIIEDTADKVEDNSEILKKIERNTSFIEKLFELQKDAIEDAKVAAEEAEIDKTKDTAGFAGFKKSKFGGDGGLLSGIPGGGMLGNILDFGGDVLDVMGRRKRGRPGARRRLAKRKTNRFFGKQKNRLFGRKKRTPIKSRSAGEFVNGRYYKKKVSQFAPKKKNFLQKGLQRTNIAGRKLGKKLISKTAQKAGTKAIAKGVGKGVGKALLKKIPILGLGVGALFAAQRAMAGDFVGAGLELASGAASTVPGFGTAASVGIDAALMAKDIHDESQMMDTGPDYGGEYETGGISEKPEIATLHGTEAIIPLSSFNRNNIFEKNQQISNFFEKSKNSSGMLQAEMGAIADGPDTGYEVELHGTEAIIPLDNKFTRGEPTVTDGGEYERGNVNVEVEREGEREKKQTLAEKKKIQKDLAESFRMGLDIYQKKTPGGFLGELGQKIMNFLDKFGDGGDGGGAADPGGDAPQINYDNLKTGDISDTAGKASVLYDEFRRQGVTDEGAKRVIAEIGREGSFQNENLFGTHTDPAAGISNTGMISWNQGRRENLIKAAKDANVWDEDKGQLKETAEALRFQVRFMLNEMQSNENYKGTYDLLTDENASGSDISASLRDKFIVYRADEQYSGGRDEEYGSGRSKEWYERVTPGLEKTYKPDEDKGEEDTGHLPNQQITNNYGLEVGQEREFITSKGTTVKAHKTTKGFEFFNRGINQKIDFTNGQNSWVINDFIKSEGGLKPEKIQTEVNPPENGGPEPPSLNQASRSDQVKASSIAAAEANTSRIVAMAMPTAQPEVSAPSPTEPAASSSGLSSKPSDIAFSGLSYNINLHQLGATA